MTEKRPPVDLTKYPPPVDSGGEPERPEPPPVRVVVSVGGKRVVDREVKG